MLPRELRFTRSRVLVLLVSLILGTAGLAAVRSFAWNVERAIATEARGLMAADLRLSSFRPFTQAELLAVQHLENQGAEVTRSIRLVSSARHSGGSRAQRQTALTVQVRAVGKGYPFYGKAELASGRPLQQALRGQQVVVESSLLYRMGLRLGDSIRLGKADFKITDVLTREPDSPMEWTRIGPRVMMSEQGMQASGLISPLQRTRYQLLLKLPSEQDPQAVAKQLRLEIPESFASIRSYQQAQPFVQRSVKQLSLYFSLIGLAALLLGGLGAAAGMRAFLEGKINNLAMLKCLGADSNRLLKIYLLLAIFGGLLGSTLGALLGIGVQQVLTGLLGDLLPVQVDWQIPWPIFAGVVLLGTLTCVWLTLPLLWRFRRTPPSLVLRHQVEVFGQSPRQRWRKAALEGAWLLCLLAGLCLWLAGWTLTALIVLGGLALGLLILRQTAEGLLWLLRRLPLKWGFAFHQGLNNLWRPGNQTAAVLSSVGLGAMMLLGILLIEQTLLRQLRGDEHAAPANVFMLDIQPGQEARLAKILKEQGLPPTSLIPVVLARIHAINNQRTQRQDAQEDKNSNYLRYQYALTYRNHLEDGEEIIAGRFFGSTSSASSRSSAQKKTSDGSVELSMAKWLQEESKLGLQDRITMDIQGVQLEGRITSIREVDWNNHRSNFSLVYPPAVLEDAPHMLVADIHIPSVQARSQLQEALGKNLPNVTVIDADAIISVLQQIVTRIALAVELLALFCLGVGLSMMLGALTATRHQRMREIALWKTLGASRWQTARILAVEYAALGSLGMLLGIFFALGLSWSLTHWVFELRLQPRLLLLGIAWAAGTLLVMVTGLAASVDILQRKPLATLSSE